MKKANRPRLAGAVAGIICLLVSVSVNADAGRPDLQDRGAMMREVVGRTKRDLTRLTSYDKSSLDRIMRDNGWEPLPAVDEGSTNGDVGLLVDGSYLAVSMSTYRHSTWPMLTVYGNYHWSSCHFATLHGSYDLLGIDWVDTELTQLDVGSNNSLRLWYRGEDPFQRSLVFNAKDPLKRWSGLIPVCDPGTLDGSAFVVFDVGAPSSQRILQFNSKYDHTYMVQTTNETWSAGLTWDTQLKGNVSYTVQIRNEERKWSKGAFVSVQWR